jgi:hypothetical protein
MKKYKFKTTIQASLGGGAAVAFPFDVEKEFGVKGNVPVKATFDGIPYSGSLMKCGFPSHMLGILKSIRTQIGKNPGDLVNVVVWKDGEARVIETPADLARLLKERGLLAAFERLSYTHRKEYCRWITEAKKEETRKTRVAKAADMLARNVKTPA